MEVSDKQRGEVQAILAAKASKDREKRDIAAGRTAVIVDSSKHTAGVSRVAQRFAECLRANPKDWLGRNALRKRAAASRDKDYVDDALRALAHSGQVDTKPTEADHRGSPGLLYRAKS